MVGNGPSDVRWISSGSGATLRGGPKARRGSRNWGGSAGGFANRTVSRCSGREATTGGVVGPGTDASRSGATAGRSGAITTEGTSAGSAGEANRPDLSMKMDEIVREAG